MNSEPLGHLSNAPNVAGNVDHSRPYKRGRRLRFKFFGDHAPDLHRIEYVDGSDAHELYRERGDPKYTLRGLKAGRALALFFLEYSFWESENQTFCFSNEVATTLYDTISKPQLQNLIAWAKRGQPNEVTPQLQKALAPRLVDNKKCVFATDFLPRDCVEFYWSREGSSLIEERQVLEKLARSIRKRLKLAEPEPTDPTVRVGTPPTQIITPRPPDVSDARRLHNVVTARSTDEIPSRIWFPVTARREGDMDTSRRNFAVRWALSRQSGTVVIHGDSAERAFECLATVEAMLARAVPEGAGIHTRPWLRIDSALPTEANLGAHLKELAVQSSHSRPNAARSADNRKLLGVFMPVDRVSDSPERCGTMIEQATDWIKAEAGTEISLVVHTQHHAAANLAHSLLSNRCGLRGGLPPELVTFAAEANSLPEVAPVGVSFWNRPAPPGYALARICQIADPEARSLLLPTYSLLAAALRGVSQPQLEDVGSTLPPLPEEVIADIHRIPADKPQIVRLVVRLLKQSPVLRGRLRSLVRLLASGRDIRIRFAVVNEATTDWDLLDAWLDALTPEVRRSIASWWISTEPAALPAVLATLFRSLKRGNEESGAIIRSWTPLLSARLQSLVNIALQLAQDGTRSFWESPANSDALLFLANCDLVGDVPFAKLPAGWKVKADFWRFLQTIPLSSEMVKWALAAGPEHRATIGLCSNPEWTALSQMHLLPQILARRG